MFAHARDVLVGTVQSLWQTVRLIVIKRCSPGIVVADVVLLFAALLPRVALARSLDLVTDEGVYIPVGMRDIVLLSHFDVFSPHWLDNFEAPALPRLFIGLGALLGAQVPNGLLLGARLPGVVFGALGLVAAFHLARPIVGDLSAWLGSLALALSPWLAYFAALAYLDTYMLVFLTLALLLTWHAVRNPALFPIVGILLGLAMACKYTALAGLVPIAGYLIYARLAAQIAISLQHLIRATFAFFATLVLADPAIWANPIVRLGNSIGFQVFHAQNGHQVFWLGSTWYHVPPGLGIVLVLAKMSLFITLPALWICMLGMVRSVQTHHWPDDAVAFLSCWLFGLMVPFSALTIIVGTHYLLPLAPPFAFAGAWGMVQTGQWLGSQLSRAGERRQVAGLTQRALRPDQVTGILLELVVLGIMLPPATGLLTIAQAEGYTSEWLPGENLALQVAYPGYADALTWIVRHTQTPTTVALIATSGTLAYWLQIRPPDFPRLKLSVGTPNAVPAAHYLVWPEHLLQRGFPTLPHWQTRIVTAIRGGATTYCYVLSG